MSLTKQEIFVSANILHSYQFNKYHTNKMLFFTRNERDNGELVNCL